MPSLSALTVILILISRQNYKTPESVNFYYQNQNFKLSANEINFSYGFNPKIKNGSEFPRFDNIVSLNFDKKILNEFISRIEKEIDKDAVEAKFELKDGKAREFQLSSNGLKVDAQKLNMSAIDAFVAGKNAVEIPVGVAKPKVTTENIDKLGIKELIGRGASTYFASIPSRVYNIALAASRVNGTLVAPGETFSFNKAVGDVSSLTGYRQAYIIKDGKTVLGDGGGVCQVSTTLFRAILNAGLPVAERRAHSYRVKYYEQDSPPGLDATVYAPSTDLKFKNDTGNYILIVARADPKKYSLVFELYGTKDGRVSEVSKPVVTNVVAPPPDLYQDDPTLPAGAIKQVDFRAYGSTVTFNYLVKRNGETIYQKTFVSNYRPWQAVYLKGTLGL